MAIKIKIDEKILTHGVKRFLYDPTMKSIYTQDAKGDYHRLLVLQGWYHTESYLKDNGIITDNVAVNTIRNHIGETITNLLNEILRKNESNQD